MSAQNASKAEVAYIFKSTALQLSLAGLVLICPIILAGPFLFSIFFGPQWEKAGLFAQILAPSVFASFVAMPLCPVLLRAAMQRTNMALQMLFPISAIAALLLCMRSGASFEDFLAIVSASYTAISGVVLAACYRALRYVR